MLRLTLRGLRAHAARLVLTALVVLMGVSFVVSVQVLTDTLRDGYDTIFTDVGANLDVVVRSSESVATAFGGEERAPIPAELLDVVRQSPGLRQAEGLVQGQTRLIGPDGDLVTTTADAPVFAFNWVDDPLLNVWVIESGRPPAGEGEMVVDAALATDQGVVVGTVVRIPTAQTTETFTVVGTARYGKARNLAGQSAALFATPVAQRIFAEPGKFDLITGEAVAGVTQEQLTSAVRQQVGVNRKAQVISGATYIKEGQDGVDQLLSIVNSLLQSFGYLGLFVSSFIIYNTFSIVVAQRSRELALLRALGAARAQVVRSVVVEAVVVGTIAALIGAAVGVGFGALVTSLLTARGFVPPDAPLAIVPVRYIAAVVVGVLVTVLSSLVPAWRASRVAPVAAMRDAEVEDRRPSRLRIVMSTAAVLGGGGAIGAGLAFNVPLRQLFVFGGMGVVFLGMAGLAPALIGPAARILGRPVQAFRAVTGRLAWENAARSPKRSGATSSAVMIGVGLVCFIAILGESFRATTTDAIDRAVQGDFVVNTRSVELQGASPLLTRQLGQQPGVQAASGLRAGLGKFDQSPVLVFGVDPTTFLQVVRFDVSAGDPTALGSDGFAITKDEAERRSWTVGTVVKASFLDKGTRDLTVRAIFSTDLLRGTNGYFVDLSLFESAFPANLQTDLQIYVKLASDTDAAAVRPALDAVVAQFPPANLEDLAQFKATRTKPIDNFVFFLWAMLLLAVVISMIGIINTLLLAVVERTCEIGLLRAGGMERAQVRSMVRWEAVILAIVGAGLGLLVGVSFAWAVVQRFRDDGLRVFALPTTQLVVILVAAGFGGVLAAVWPARRAANLDILDAIAHE